MPQYTRSKPDGLNRRVHPRTQTDVRAFIKTEAAAQACVIRDRSVGGARLVTTVDFSPSTAIFDLVEEASGASKRVQLIWADRRQLGVRYLDVAATPARAATAKPR